jgi:ketosteroid isomerase-like protein
MEERLKSLETAKQFYAAFAKADVNEMLKHYGSEIIFSDPVFGILKGEQAFAMWRMLVRPGIDIQAKEPEFADNKVIVNWRATYIYSPTGRKVVNHVKAQMTIRDGKIIAHHDTFSLWRWSAQALGLSGYFLGWTSVVKRKISSMANANLRKFMEKQKEV